MENNYFRVMCDFSTFVDFGSEYLLTLLSWLSVSKGIGW